MIFLFAVAGVGPLKDAGVAFVAKLISKLGRRGKGAGLVWSVWGGCVTSARAELVRRSCDTTWRQGLDVPSPAGIG
jgi:hypothetical protein